ncbi:MAG: DNA mismatch repair protein MutL, partial [Lachnospiraceae bacterium]|nr:DNA mismatch repair protein MutL [Lachnospiraceae bacterium]
LARVSAEIPGTAQEGRAEAESVKAPDTGERKEEAAHAQPAGRQMELKFLSQESAREHRLIGQVFGTYWLVEFHEKLYIIDQHAAHEKVLYERTMKNLENKEFTSQQLSPPMILTLSMQEEELLRRYMEHFTRLGFEISPFGGREYAVSAVPANLYGIAQRELFLEMLDGMAEQPGRVQAEMINEKIASMSCKAAVKGNHQMSAAEADALIDELLRLENPYNCPHGRPTIISMTKYEMEKKFKRIV